MCWLPVGVTPRSQLTKALASRARGSADGGSDDGYVDFMFMLWHNRFGHRVVAGQQQFEVIVITRFRMNGDHTVEDTLVTQADAQNLVWFGMTLPL